MIDVENIVLRFSVTRPEAEDIRSCLSALYAVREGTQPMDRSFGLSTEFVGKPLPVAKNELAVEIIQKTRLYEPRVKVTQVLFDCEPESGKLRPVVYVEGSKRG